MCPKPHKHKSAPKLLGTYYRFVLKPPLDVLVPDPGAAPAANGSTREPYVLMHTPKSEAQVPAARVVVAERATAEDVVDTPVDAPSKGPLITAFDATPERPESPGEVTGLIEHLSLAGGGTYSTDGDAALKRSNDLTVGTWNLLNPVYAIRNFEPEGIKVGPEGESTLRQLKIHADNVGLLVGVGGLVIKQLTEEAKAKKIRLNLDKTEKGPAFVELTGGSVHDCILLVDKILNTVNQKEAGWRATGKGTGWTVPSPGDWVESNWKERFASIGRILARCRLDVYLLQEARNPQPSTLNPKH